MAVESDIAGLMVVVGGGCWQMERDDSVLRFGTGKLAVGAEMLDGQVWVTSGKLVVSCDWEIGAEIFNVQVWVTGGESAVSCDWETTGTIFTSRPLS